MRDGTVQRIESNGLVFGVLPQSEYPVRDDIVLSPGDRLILYTDGLIEPENANGQSFGDFQLEKVILDSHVCQPLDFVNRLLSNLRSWPPRSTGQQDDVTLVTLTRNSYYSYWAREADLSMVPRGRTLRAVRNENSRSWR